MVLGVGNGSPLQYSCLGNPMDRESLGGGYSQAVRAGLDGVAKSRAQLSTFLMLPFRVLVIHIVLFFKLRRKLNTIP